jgi:CRP-like cAMP-binding protein
MGCNRSVLDVERVLSLTPCFYGASPELIHAAAEHFEQVRAKKNEIIFDAGDPADRLFVIARGSVAIRQVDENNKERTVCERKSCECFGQIALQHKTLRTAKVMALERTHFITLSRRAFEAHKNSRWMQVLQNFLEDTTTQIIVEKLKDVPFLRSTPQVKLELLSTLFRCIAKQEGEVICQEGEQGDSFYILMDGHARVTIKDKTGGDDSQVVHTMGPGSYFGEMALVQNTPRAATVQATERCFLLVLAMSDFSNFLALAPSVKDQMLQMVTERSAANIKAIGVPFFEYLSPQKLSLLAQLCTLRELAPHEVVCTKGEEGHAFYIVSRGQVEVLSSDVVHSVRARIAKGGYFGEVALVADVPRTATVVNGSNGPDGSMTTVLLELRRKDFQVRIWCGEDSMVRIWRGEDSMVGIWCGEDMVW